MLSRTPLVIFSVAALGLGVTAFSVAGEPSPVAGPGNPVVQLGAEGGPEWLVAPSGKARVLKLAQGKNAVLSLLTLEPGAPVPFHRDSTEEYLFIQEGGGSLTLDGATHELTAGSVVYMRAGAEVAFLNGPRQTIALQVFAGPEPAVKYDSWTALADSVFGVADRLAAAMSNVNSIRTAEKAYHAEWDAFTSAPTCPSDVPGADPRPWTGSCSSPYENLGWAADGDVRCSYRVQAKPGKSSVADDFEIWAECDLDGDGEPSVIRADRAQRATVMTPDGVY